MSISFKYKGRSFANARAMSVAVERGLKADMERKLRQAASNAGVQISKKADGKFEIKGSTTQMERFNSRFGK
jgi:hypothetical protein